MKICPFNAKECGSFDCVFYVDVQAVGTEEKIKTCVFSMIAKSTGYLTVCLGTIAGLNKETKSMAKSKDKPKKGGKSSGGKKKGC